MPLTFINNKSLKRVLIYRPGSLGDTIIALPALNIVARAFPQAERRMLTNLPVNAKAAPAAAVLENTGLIHSFVGYPLGTRNFRHLLTLWWRIVKWRPQVLIYMAGRREVGSPKRDAAFFRLCGIPRLIGVPCKEDVERLRGEAKPTTKPWAPFEHEASRLTRIIAELGDGQLDDAANWDLHLTSAEHARAAEVLAAIGDQPFFAVSIGTKKQSSDWGQENWRGFLGRLAKVHPAHALAIFGVSVESEVSEFIASGWRQQSSNPAVNLCGVLTPRESAAVMKRADIFIGHDSGPMHLAAAVQTPCVAVFAARDLPGIWFPYGKRHRVIYREVDCAGCGLHTCIIEKKRCITSIKVEDVIAEVMTLLPSTSAVPTSRMQSQH